MPSSDSDTTKEPGGSNVIAISRMAHDPRTRTYVDCRTTEGLSKKRDHRLWQAVHRPRALQDSDPAENPDGTDKDLAKAA
jgi:hypothetical protein